MKIYELEFIQKGLKAKKLIKASNLNVAQNLALKENLQILSLKEVKKPFFKTKISGQNFILFFKELSLLSGVGLSIKEALKELSKNHKNFDKIIAQINENLNLGQNLSKAFETPYLALNSGELALIKMAENTGKLSKIFMQIAELREKSLQNQKRVKKAIRYPLIVFLSVCGAFLFLMFFVVGEFENLFENLGVDLPLMTRILLGIYEFLNKYYLFLAVFFLCVLLNLFFLYKKSNHFASICDFLVFKTPLLSHFMLCNQNYYFFIIFSLLLKSGIPTSKAFKIAYSSIKNRALFSKFKDIENSLSQGIDLSVAFEKVKIFDSVVISMLNVAMKSAKLELLSNEIANFYERKQEDFMDKFLALLEPLMTLVVGILVLFLALGIFLPLWELGSGVKF
ncbi:type II secretion system F family protein [Campylobacter cuniculorum]|uniref:Transformation system, type II secretion system membrane protein CtsF n=2 Tax=Campylobacter cuniculorum TaxID=374106 RepID=A0A1W6BUF9_9BACT|nr:type II secretion system F family protein [Campylobacter cuniculorum]ARJ55729.1 transformation system, type II secretion system membrane protein CtsF [Campylobacter cuniculorum DSM 23162 = LMG 24588]QOR04950.1 type II secretion system F family protein [Campylobacter cuniculorum]